jgi:hypothetical protein
MGTLSDQLRRSASKAVGGLLTRAIVGVGPPAGRDIEAGLMEDVYARLLRESVWRRARQAPGDLAVRYLAFAAKRGRLTASAPDPVGGRILPRLPERRDALIDKALVRLCATPRAGRQLRLLQELAEVESAVRGGSTDEQQLGRLLELAPTEVRLVRDRARSRDGRISDSVREALEPAEVLAYVAGEVSRYGSATEPNRSMLYTAFVDVHGDAAPDRLRDEVAAYYRLFLERLDDVPPQDRSRVEELCGRRFAAALGDYPVPTPGRPAEVGGGVSGSVVLFGLLCVVGWLVAYASIISRGFADATYGVPLPALVANLSWEFAYGFLLDPLGDYFHTASIFGFLIDLVIGWQAWKYGGRQFAGTPAGRHFRPFLLLSLAVAFPVTYLAFLEFNDPDGEYTGFGINLMMSILFLVMLERRGGPDGQSMYIAVGKWLGTFCAWVATALTVTTSPDRTWPAGWRQFIRDSLRNRSYPLTPLINVMYGWTFMLDAVYSVLLYRRLRLAGIPPWRRF